MKSCGSPAEETGPDRGRKWGRGAWGLNREELRKLLNWIHGGQGLRRRGWGVRERAMAMKGQHEAFLGPKRSVS